MNGPRYFPLYAYAKTVRDGNAEHDLLFALPAITKIPCRSLRPQMKPFSRFSVWELGLALVLLGDSALSSRTALCQNAL
jgi:hypothetical protein